MKLHVYVTQSCACAVTQSVHVHVIQSLLPKNFNYRNILRMQVLSVATNLL